MLDDDQQEKDAARNQLILFMMMAVMIFLWFNFFAKKPQQPADTPQTQVAQSATTSAVALEPAVAAATPAEAEPGKPAAAPAPESGWPALPAVATPATNPTDDEVTITKDDMVFVFTKVGARLKKAILKLDAYGNNEDVVQLVPPSTAPDAEAVYPFGLRFSNDALHDELDRRRFEVDNASATDVTFKLTLPGAAVVRKRFSFDPDHPHVLNVTVEYQNLEATPRILGQDQSPAYIVSWGPNIDSQDLTKGVHQALVWRVNNETANLPTASMKPSDNKPFVKRIPDMDWVAVRSAYFLVAIKPEFKTNAGWSLGDATQFRFGVEVPRAEIAPNETLRNDFKVYIGPSHLTHLKKAWPTLDTSLRFFDWNLFDWFAKFLLQMLNWFHSVIPNYGVAIVLLTIVVRMVMFPLTMKQMKTMKRMQMLAPEMEKIKQQYGEDPQEMQRRTMELYKEYGLNPAGGCLPMVLQLPIFVSLYRMIWSAYELRGAPFVFWIKDLSQPDKLFHIPQLSQLPWIFSHLEYINVLPLLSALAMVASVKLTPMSGPVQNPQQKMMMTIMPVMFSLFCYSLASGVNVYILTSTVLGIAQSYIMRMFDVEKPEKVKPRKKQHFYTAAIEKKKQAERELKEKKKRKDNKQEN